LAEYQPENAMFVSDQQQEERMNTSHMKEVLQLLQSELVQ
jgi:hypothetical protein